MRVLFLLPVTAALFLTGCGQSSNSTSQPAHTNAAVNNANGNSAAAAPNYLGVAGQAEKFSEKQIDLAYLRQAIEQFNAVEGHYPKSLQQLVPNYIGKIQQAPPGSKIDYDPKTGTVKLVKQ